LNFIVGRVIGKMLLGYKEKYNEYIDIDLVKKLSRIKLADYDSLISYDSQL